MNPGSHPQRPLWIRDVPDTRTELVRSIDLGMKIVTFGYTVMTAWQIAKLMNPRLQVQETLLIARIKTRFARAVNDLPPLSNADRAYIYDATRSPCVNSGCPDFPHTIGLP